MKREHNDTGVDLVRRAFEEAIKVTLNPQAPRHLSPHPSPNQLPQTGLSQMSMLSHVSCPSHLSTSRFLRADWDDLEIDVFEERAAILEYEAGYSRNLAEYLARKFIDLSLPR